MNGARFATRHPRRRTQEAHRGLGRALPVLVLAGAVPAAGLSTGAAVLSAAPAYAAPPACSGSGAPSYTFTDVAGSPQSAKVGSAFATPLEVQVTETLGTGTCPAADINVEFTVEATGAGATFNGGLTAVSVETDGTGTATAPTLYANNVTGSYTVTAGFDGYSSPPLDLSNTTVGVVSSVTAGSGGGQSAQIGGAFAAPLQVTVTDSYGDPVAGATVGRLRPPVPCELTNRPP